MMRGGGAARPHTIADITSHPDPSIDPEMPYTPRMTFAVARAAIAANELGLRSNFRSAMRAALAAAIGVDVVTSAQPECAAPIESDRAQ